MQALAQLPADAIPGVATALAGKGASDPLSRSYAAALAFYADMNQRRGVLTNGRNGEGWYFVRIPDPRAGGDARPVMNADGTLYQLDLRPLIERAARFPEGLTPLPDAATRARRAAPANPTEGLAPQTKAGLLAFADNRKLPEKLGSQLCG